MIGKYTFMSQSESEPLGTESGPSASRVIRETKQSRKDTME